MLKGRVSRIVSIFVAIASIHFADEFIGLPVFMTAVICAFWYFLARQIWLSRADGVNDWRYNLAVAILLLFFAAFAATTFLPIYEALAARMGWPQHPIPLLAN